LESYLPVNLLGPGPRLIKKKRIYRAAVSQRLRNAALEDTYVLIRCLPFFRIPATFNFPGRW